MRKHVRLLFTCAFAAALGGGLFSTTSVRATLFTGDVDFDINNGANWETGLPDNSGNPGTVPTGFATTHNSVDALDSPTLPSWGIPRLPVAVRVSRSRIAH